MRQSILEVSGGRKGFGMKGVADEQELKANRLSTWTLIDDDADFD
jgi:hypothetical protein